MERYTPLFSKIVHSSLWGEPDNVRILFVTMMALQDRDHVVRFTAYALAQMARKTEEEVMEALEVLSSPDTRRKEKQEFDGRRIEKVDGGWLMLNGKKYQDQMMSANRREYKRAWMEKTRGKRSKNCPTLAERVGEVPVVEAGAVQGDGGGQ